MVFRKLFKSCGSALRRSDQSGGFPDHHREVGARQRPAQRRARGRDADPQGNPRTATRQRVVNILRDRYNNRAGRDPKAMNKPEHGEKVIEAQKGIAVPRRQLLHYGQVDWR